jgi:hypothetical protein
MMVKEQMTSAKEMNGVVRKQIGINGSKGEAEIGPEMTNCRH